MKNSKNYIINKIKHIAKNNNIEIRKTQIRKISDTEVIVVYVDESNYTRKFYQRIDWLSQRTNKRYSIDVCIYNKF